MKHILAGTLAIALGSMAWAAPQTTAGSAKNKTTTESQQQTKKKNTKKSKHSRDKKHANDTATTTAPK